MNLRPVGVPALLLFPIVLMVGCGEEGGSQTPQAGPSESTSVIAVVEQPPAEPLTSARLEITIESTIDADWPIRLSILLSHVGTDGEVYDGGRWQLERWDGVGWQEVAVLPFDSNASRVDRACPVEPDGSIADWCESAAAEGRRLLPGDVGARRDYDLFPVPAGWYRVRGWALRGADPDTAPLSEPFELG